jgi:hypothetical protein
LNERSLQFALFYAAAINVLVNCLCVSLVTSGGLRLLSLAKNSEEAGKYLTRCLFQ